jgi:hypothetical protein
MNDATIAQTCLATADHFIAAAADSEPSDLRIAGFFDLLSTAEAVGLYDTLYFIKGAALNLR